MNEQPLIVILGATASGKTKLAVQLAHLLQAEIISADSRQVYRGMDIGTGKDLNEYMVDGQLIPYHLVNVVDAGTKYHVNNFLTDFHKTYEALQSKGTPAILCGGTGMYIHSLLQNYQYTSIPVDETLRTGLLTETRASLAEKLDTYPGELTIHADRSTVKRLIRAIEIAEYLQNDEIHTEPHPKVNAIVIGLVDDVAQRRAKIYQRLERRLEEGLLAEVEVLLDSGVSADMLEFYGLEYKLSVQFLQGKLDFDSFKAQLFTQICQYAKRQMTYFRKMEKDGVHIHWFQADTAPETILKGILAAFQGAI